MQLKTMGVVPNHKLVQGGVTVALVFFGLKACRGLLRSWRRHQQLSKIPCPPSSPILGHLAPLLQNPIHLQAAQWSQEMGQVYKLYLLNKVIVVLTDPDTAKYLKHGPTYMPKSARTYQPFRTLSGANIDSILTSPENDYWKVVRRGLAPAFAVNNLKRTFPDAIALSLRTAAYLKHHGDGAIDMDNIAQRITVDIIGQMVFGIALGACNYEAHNEPLEIVKNVLEAMQEKGMNPLADYLPFLPRARNFRHWCNRFGDLGERIVKNAQASSLPPNSIMSALFSIKDPRTGEPLSMRQLIAEVDFLLVAGFETTAHSIAWTLMCLSTHDSAMKRVEDELESLGLLSTPTKEARTIDWSDLGRLKALDAAINESMRLFPVTSTGPFREPTEDLKVGNYVIPKGTVVMLHSYSIHHSKEAWGPDAEEFKPERWDNKGDDVQGSVGRRPGYQPFSLGPRDCAGQNLAMLELRVVLATLIGRFRFRLAKEMGDFQTATRAARQYITLKPMVPDPHGNQSTQPGLLMHCTPRR
ncbi:cytochrome P450 [Dunaliella salina]|uniref:Cytochrome P450 n=1 Tax=Dunaliella salina TaxID=3046 RepID=A0ABQ7FXX0_DUNSA|nr:cytochrome P450 [Dunaliella salina]|eukprot:KAF5827172.1 cytochrome P450 [Dunaliella salina]